MGKMYMVTYNHLWWMDYASGCVLLGIYPTEAEAEDAQGRKIDEILAEVPEGEDADIHRLLAGFCISEVEVGVDIDETLCQHIE